LGALQFVEAAVRIAGILLDLKMPKVDGMEVLRRVKGDPKLKNIPIVILTSSREDCDMVKGYNLGASAFVVKPVRFNEFVEAVNEPPPEPSVAS